MKVYQYLNNAETAHVLYRKCMEKSKVLIPVDYELIERETDRPEIYSRSLRLNLLKNDPEGLWLDADCVVNKWFDFEFEKGYPYILRDGGCSAAVIYCNGRTDIFCDLLERQKSSKSCPCVLIESCIDKFRYIPNGYIAHLKLGRLAKNTQKSFSSGNKFFSVTKKSDEYTLKIA